MVTDAEWVKQQWERQGRHADKKKALGLVTGPEGHGQLPKLLSQGKMAWNEVHHDLQPKSEAEQMAWYSPEAVQIRNAIGQKLGIMKTTLTPQKATGARRVLLKEMQGFKEGSIDSAIANHRMARAMLIAHLEGMRARGKIVSAPRRAKTVKRHVR